MLDATDDERIRAGLSFLAKTDEALINAGHPLAEITGISDPPGVTTLLDKYTFRVAGTDYAGLMTEPQFQILDGHKGSLREFADAIADVLIYSTHELIEAARGINRGLIGADLKVDMLAVADEGCCTYDTGMHKNTGKDNCYTGLKGSNWVKEPCKREDGGDDDDKYVEGAKEDASV